MRCVPLFPLSGEDVRRHGPLAGPLAVTDGEQDGPRGADVRLRQRREDLQHRQRCQDFLIVRSSLLSTSRDAGVCVRWGLVFKTSLALFVCLSSLMQRRYSEPNTYIDTPPSIPHDSEELYDDVASIADPEVCSGLNAPSQTQNDGTQTDSESYWVQWVLLCRVCRVRVNHIKNGQYDFSNRVDDQI